jgi:hypothetical protein
VVRRHVPEGRDGGIVLIGTPRHAHFGLHGIAGDFPELDIVVMKSLR